MVRYTTILGDATFCADQLNAAVEAGWSVHSFQAVPLLQTETVGEVSKTESSLLFAYLLHRPEDEPAEEEKPPERRWIGMPKTKG